MSRESQERRLFTIVIDALTRWLERIREAVMRPWRQYQALPDPAGVYDVPWMPHVDQIERGLEEVYQEGWEETTGNLGIDLPYTSTDTFVQAQVAKTQNLLVRIPDEVADRIFAEISDGISGGEWIQEIAERVDNMLLITGSPNWPNRALVVAQTEVNRAANSGALAAGLMAQQFEGVAMVKEWLTSDDARVRMEHREVDNMRVPIDQPFSVGESTLMYPGDPAGAPHDVINCRCSLLIKEA